MSYLDNTPPPKELKLARQVDRWGALPNAGGLRDQETGLLDRMAWASAVYSAFQGRLGARNAIAWIDANPDQYDLYADVKKMLQEDGLI